LIGHLPSAVDDELPSWYADNFDIVRNIVIVAVMNGDEDLLAMLILVSQVLQQLGSLCPTRKVRSDPFPPYSLLRLLAHGRRKALTKFDPTRSRVMYKQLTWRM
jgi:hypothetical protein